MRAGHPGARPVRRPAAPFPWLADQELRVSRRAAGVPESQGDQDRHEGGEDQRGDRRPERDGGEGAEGIGLQKQPAQRGAVERGLLEGLQLGVARLGEGRRR